MTAALLVALLQVGKSWALLGAEPDEALLEVRTRHKQMDRWFEDVSWSG